MLNNQGTVVSLSPTAKRKKGSVRSNGHWLNAHGGAEDLTASASVSPIYITKHIFYGGPVNGYKKMMVRRRPSANLQKISCLFGLFRFPTSQPFKNLLHKGSSSSIPPHYKLQSFSHKLNELE